MLHRTVWDAPSASSKKKLVLNQEKGQKMLPRTVWDAPSASSKKRSQFQARNRSRICYIELYGTRRPPVRKKEVSFRLETGVENVTSNCMARAVRQFEKEKLVLGQKQEQDMLNRNVWDAPSGSSKRKLVLNQEQEQEMIHRTVWDAPSASSKKKLVLYLSLIHI